MKSLRTQLTLTIIVVVLVTVALISLLANILIDREFESYIMEQQQMKTEDIISNLGLQYNGLTSSWNVESIHTIGMYALSDGYIIKIYSEDGKSVWDAENHDTSRCNQIMDEISDRMEKYGTEGEFVSQKYAITQNGEKVGDVDIRYYGPYFLSESDSLFLDSLNELLLAICIFSLMFSFIAGWFLAKGISRPIVKTADIAGKISAGNYAIRFEGETKTKELHLLVGAINHLASALDKQENLRKQLTSDVAHELRTPLASVGSHLEAMILNVWEPTSERLKSCYEEIIRLGKIVEDLERLEKVESDNLKLDKADVDLLQLARNVCDNFEAEFANKNLHISIEGKSSVISLDRDRISGVITNLISNAVKYTSEGGRIRVCVQDFDSESILTVEDNGSGIPESELPFVFERFYRADKSRNRNTGGAGIGLAIVKSIVLAHNGTVGVQSVGNGGSCFTVTLPK